MLVIVVRVVGTIVIMKAVEMDDDKRDKGDTGNC